MVTSDMPFFMRQYDDLAKGGHVNDVNSSERILFEKQIREALALNEAGGNSGHLFVMLIKQSDDKPAGVMWVKGSRDLEGQDCIELSVLHVVESMRGKGGGNLLLSIALDGYRQYRITAKCFPPSVIMSAMLKRRGFEVMGTSERGSEYLCLLPV